MQAEQLTVEERLLRMEAELKNLRKRNDELQREVESLRDRLQSQQELFEEVGTLPPESESQASAGETVSARYRDGFQFHSSDGQYKLQLGGRITTRYTAFESGHPSNDEFSLERGRLYTNATLYDLYDLRVQVEFSENPTLKDGYLNIRHIPYAQLELGQFKVPFMWEFLQSHKYIDFAERSIATDNMRFDGRDIGIMLHGKPYDKMVEYQLAIVNGTGENQGDDNDEKDIVGRFALRPFRQTGTELLSDLHLGVAATWGDQNTDFSRTAFDTVAGTDFVVFANNTTHKGDRTRLGGEFIWPFGPASIKAELIRMWLDDMNMGAAREDFEFTSGYVLATYLLTGERKTLGKVRPLHPFDPAAGGWGAWEIAARYAAFRSDSDLFRHGFAEGTDQADAFTAGLNWYLNSLLRITLNYEHTEFDDELVIDGETLDDEDALLVQCQLEF
ncbi:MAG: outer membrane porin OprO [Candidatus Abyssubacteria bacterium]